MSKKALITGNMEFINRKYSAVTDVLEYMVDNYPQKGATYISFSGDEQFFSYPEIKKQALQMLNALQEHGIKNGDIIIVEVDEPYYFHLMFWACAYGGIALASMSHPSSWDLKSEAAKTVISQINKLGNPVVVTQSKNSTFYESLKSVIPDFKYLKLEDLKSKESGICFSKNEDDVFYIQFTSGTTGNPEAVMLSHKNIIKSSLGAATLTELKEDDDIFSWLPHTHNLGLFAPLIISMMIGNSMFCMTPPTFLKNPILFLKKIEEHKGAWFCTNNFGLEWMIKSVPDEVVKNLDLSSVKSIFAGAENISDDTINRFFDKFGKCGMKREIMRPGYGMSESTLVISMTSRFSGPIIEYVSRRQLMDENVAVNVDKNLKSDMISITGNGVPITDVTIRIADDNNRVVDESVVGEIQIRGDSIFKGYYGDEVKTKEKVVDGWLHTGDLGYIHNGQLFIVGRKKDVVIIRGSNYAITDIENIINKELPSTSIAVSSALSNDKEEIIVFVERQTAQGPMETVAAKIMNCVRRTLNIEVSNVIPIDRIPKTSSGKTKRYKLRMQFESGCFKEVYNQEKIQDLVINKRRPIKTARSETEKMVLDCWSKVLHRNKEEISVDDCFADLGGQSVQAFQLLLMLSEKLNCELGHEIIATCKTVEDMAAYLENMDFKPDGGEIKENQLTAKNSENLIAITGLAFRFPSAKNQEELWNNLCHKKNCIKLVSDKRKRLSQCPSWNDYIGELEDIDSFDYNFFDISKKEAEFMDPQHRIIMETAYEALEDAGIIVTDNEQRNIGVYAGISSNSYYPLVLDYIKENGYDDIPPETLVDNMGNIVAARITHQYNFTGPAMLIDTACSSFMTAFHTAKEALENNEIEGAVVTGSNIMATPYLCGLSKKAGIISPSNVSKVFDKDADGTIFGEGVIVVYLEKLNKAIQNNKNIYGIIYGSAINNDGYALSITSPNPRGQYDVLRAAYDSSPVCHEDISYLEAHGTGTKIGDPIEMSALSRAFKRSVENTYKIYIGSVKTNIGHLLSAAGGAGIAKVLMCIKNRQIAPSLNMNNINPMLEIEKTPFSVAVDNMEWKTVNGKPRIAGITSLGLGGTNAHVIIGENTTVNPDGEPHNHLLCFSAKTEDALERMVKENLACLKSSKVDIYNFCMTRNRFRSSYSYRAACIIDKNGNVLDGIEKNVANGKFALRVSPFIGDIRKEGTKEEFRSVLNALMAYKNSIQKFGKASGEGSGKIFADLLNGILDESSAEEKYLNYSDEIDETQDCKITSGIILKFGTIRKGLSAFGTDDRKIIISGKLEAPDDDSLGFLKSIKQVYLHGGQINWEYIYPNGIGHIVNLPAYPFEKNSVWINHVSNEENVRK
jgi:acyl-CoA synthetase (AMP-forming)/AMP-acid ligase II/3-oxoacyl-(acyl-carrier-protein) synthase/acyl carrier protein